MTEETKYCLLKLLDARPGLTQRQLALELGMSVGKVNYCLRTLVREGWVDVREYKNSNQKRAHEYLLTPRGAEERTQATKRFLGYKMTELKELKVQIKRLKKEIEGGNDPRGSLGDGV